MDPFIHPNALCESSNVGANTRVWAFAHVLPGAVIGTDCNICDGVFVENDVRIGDRVTVKCGVQVWDGVTLEDGVFVGPNVTFTNDVWPRSKQHPGTFARTQVCKGASIGANATILPGIKIGQSAMVGAGAVVTQSVPANAVVTGNPARIVGFVDPDSRTMIQPQTLDGDSPVISRVRRVSTNPLSVKTDSRGTLGVGEFGKDVPFAAKRCFFISDVPPGKWRGDHAHHNCHQFLVCARGSCSIAVTDGHALQEYHLRTPRVGLHLGPLVWGTLYRFSSDAVLLVFASEHYDDGDYLRRFEDFISAVEG
jgi:UDP-2-acetamido-3-amino-2,3-dideoxy-glucuronate N-acetyltransferase